MTKVKICGITRLDDAICAAEEGADFLGFIFVPESPRYVEPEKAEEIVRAVWSGGRFGHREGRRPERPPLHFVGVFRNASLQEMQRVAPFLDYIQLHGNESEDVVRAVGLPVIKAVQVQETLPDTGTSADWLLFDSGGGTGRTFDWSLLAQYDRTKPFLLAGGITPENADAAIETVRPDAIDCASGVESAPGVKDHRKIRRLFEKVRGR